MSYLSLSGAALALIGVLVYSWASPSPHGYIEVFIAVPMVTLGLLLLAVGFTRSEHRLLRVTGWILGVGLVALVSIAIATS